MDRFDPFVKYADVYGDIINWEKDPMNKPQNQNKYFFSDGKTYYEQICKMLRLMSVFKEAFNQIYSNEDEISEAWENFVNNLSASVVEGSEPDVTLTWTDDSVNFEFTMVPGVQGDPGVGITSISFNSDYTMTITLSDGNTYTSMSLKGETGPQGPQGETGNGLQILDVYATLADLQSAHPTGQPGDAYQVGSGENYTLYIWSSSQSAWVQAGTLGTVSPSTSAPLMDGTASSGSQNVYSRGDHVHPTDTSRASKEELDALIKTSQSLIDQSFTYRESPAVQDGLARIDKIKGNTLVWNQLIQTQMSHDFEGDVSNQNWYLGQIANIVGGHKYAYVVTQKQTMASNTRNTMQIQYVNTSSTNVTNLEIITPNANLTAGKRGWVFTAPTDNKNNWIGLYYWCHTPNIAVTIENPMLVDLTEMFGSGNEPANIDEEFLSLFTLPFYDYNQGSLLSFNGNGIKTVGKNLLNINNYRSMDSAWTLTNGVLESNNSSYKNYVSETIVGTGHSYTLSFKYNVSQNRMYAIQIYNRTDNVQLRRFEFQSALTNYSVSDVLENGKEYDIRVFGYSATSGTIKLYDVQLEIGDVATDYEPYTSSTLSLPISTYFPTGMKSAGNVYDELTPTKAITRIGEIGLGTLPWGYSSTSKRFYCIGFANNVKNNNANTLANALCDVYSNGIWNDVQGDATKDKVFSISESNVLVRDLQYTTASAFKQAMIDQNIKLYYELATPTETDVDLDLNFMAYENGTEQLLPSNGPVPSTSPIIADMTYLSIDDAMEYIIEKLANVPENTQQILDSLEDDVADLQTDVGALQPAVSALQTSVGNINTNIGQLSSTVAGHTASISDMKSDISDLNTGLSNLEDTVTDNTSRIGTLETGLSTTNGNVQSLSSQVQSIDGRVTNLETDLLIVVKKEYDFDSVAGNGNFGVQTPLSQEPGYKIIGIVGSEVQQGEYTSAEPWIIVTQAHVYYNSTGGVVLSMEARNVSEYTKTNVRVYLYLLCIKDTQS